MKKGNTVYKLIFTGILTLSLAACSGSSSSSGSSDNDKVTTVPIQQIVQNNITGVLQPTATSGILIALRGLHPSLAAAYPLGIDLELDLGTVTGVHGDLDAKQGGDITLHKKQSNGQVSYSYFTSGGNDISDVKENYWHYNNQGKLVWRGAFEGPAGTIVVVVDGVYKSGDGNDPFDYMSGSVWFKAWSVVDDTGISSDKCYIKNGRVDCKNPSGPLVRCWDVSLGPYDCRFTVSGDSKNVTATKNQYMQDEYVKVADFIDLSKDKTFKEAY
jgi:hypothetical protein